MELKKYTFKENLLSFTIGSFLGVVLTLCNSVVREKLAEPKEPIMIPAVEVIYIETPPYWKIKFLPNQSLIMR